MNGYTGRLLQEEACGLCRTKDRGYQSYKKALAEVRENQPWDHTDGPAPRFARDLHAEVALAVGLEDWAHLRFYTAIGSSLDRWHGVDAFFDLHGVVVTLDVTMNPGKFNGYKADFMVVPEAVENAEARGSLAREIASALTERQRSVAQAQPR